jgi:hypothetical protein
MKISHDTQFKLYPFLLLFFVTGLGFVSVKQSKENITKLEGLYKKTLIKERSIGMLYTSIFGLHRDLKDLSLDTLETEINVELNWIKWWKLRSFGLVDTIYKEYTGNLGDVDTLKQYLIELNSLSENTIELMRQGRKAEVLNRTKTNGVIGYAVQKLLIKLDKISNISIKQDDELYLKIFQLGTSFDRLMIFFIVLVFLISIYVSIVLNRNINKFWQRKLFVKMNLNTGNWWKTLPMQLLYIRMAK